LRLRLSWLIGRNFSRTLPLLGCLLWWTTGVQASDLNESGFFSRSGLQVRTYPLSSGTNWGSEYQFELSVLGLEGTRGYLPLLAIAIERESEEDGRWLAFWNLSSDTPSKVQRLKALFRFPWSPSGDDRMSARGGLPLPCLSRSNLKPGVWSRLHWKAIDRGSSYWTTANPARFFLKNYIEHDLDLEERRFYQAYTLLRLYEEVAPQYPSGHVLPPQEILDLKYHLLINRGVLGLLAEKQTASQVVQGFESRLRTQVGMTASFLHSQAALYHLRFEEVPFGLPGRPPISFAAALYIRKSDLPADLPEWPRRNPFDLGYNPYEHQEVRQLLDSSPEERIPLAFYVLASDFRLKPVLVLDFFGGRTGRGAETSRIARVTLDEALALAELPVLYRAFQRLAGYAIDKKDYGYFNKRKTVAGVETVRLFSRLQWQFDPDMSRTLSKALESRIINPLAASLARENEIARSRLDALLEQNGTLALHLRRVLEDEVRDTLEMGDRAVFKDDFLRFRSEREYRAAVELLRAFNRDVNETGFSWERLIQAWKVVSSRPEAKVQQTLQAFQERMRRTDPLAIPERVREEASMVVQSGGSARYEAPGILAAH
jgi:hypothetical protein